MYRRFLMTLLIMCCTPFLPLLVLSLVEKFPNSTQKQFIMKHINTSCEQHFPGTVGRPCTVFSTPSPRPSSLANSKAPLIRCNNLQSARNLQVDDFEKKNQHSNF